jgi:hypothetical protein
MYINNIMIADMESARLVAGQANDTNNSSFRGCL